MVKMKPATIGDAISGEIYKGIALMDEDPESTRIVLDAGSKKYLFDLNDPNAIILEE